MNSASRDCRTRGVHASSSHAQPGVRQGQLHSAVVRHSQLGAAAASRPTTCLKPGVTHSNQSLHQPSRSGAHGSMTSTLQQPESCCQQDSMSSLQDEHGSNYMSACSSVQRAGNTKHAGRPLTDIDKQHMLLKVLQQQQVATASTGSMVQQHTLNRVHVSGSSDKGPKKKAMEDRYTIAALCAVNGPLDNWTGCIDLSAATAFAAVYDGHGGHMTAAHAAHQLHRHLYRKLHHHKQHHPHQHRHNSSSSSLSGGGGGGRLGFCNPISKHSRQHSGTDLQLVSVLEHTFSDYDDHWRDETMGMQFDHSGSTAVVALVDQHKLVVANAGDSIAILARGGSAMRVSHLHKAGSDEAESARVAAAGGVFCKGKSGLRVMQNPASLPAGERYAKQPHLTVTRSLGDYKLKRHGHPIVSAQPYVHHEQLTQQDTLLLLASDGVTDVLTDQQMVDIALSAVQQASSCVDSSEDLARAAAAGVKARALEAGAWDNLTVVAMYLDWA